MLKTIDVYEKTMPVKQIVGERVNLWLRRRGLMQMHLAEKLNITSATMSTKISGKTSWSVEDLVKTAAFLDLDIEDLLPNETVLLEKQRSSNLSKSEDLELVAEAGFEPTTSGL